ncbi:MAG TPA: TolC family protein [Gammaproteobacteria bacterium]|nr:TolC family protein [Gammaproteobacteria bacterium]
MEIPINTCNAGGSRYLPDIVVFTAGIVLAAAVAASPTTLLTLEQAIDAALQQNRSLENAGMEVDKAADSVAATRTRQYPNLELGFSELYNLTSQSFTFDAGTFGPVPPQDVEIDSRNDFTPIVSLSIKQPLSELYRIGLTIDQSEVTEQIAGQQLRARTQSVVNEVKQAYYDILRTRSSLEATEASITYYTELQREVSEDYRQQTVLEYQLLEVESRLARARHEALTQRNRLATEQERLNTLMGRAVDERFSVSDPGMDRVWTPDSDQAEITALAQRPEVSEAALKLEHARYGYRIKKSEYLPDVDLSLRYMRLYNTEFIPDEESYIGLTARWEFYDWGRKSSDLSQKNYAIHQARNQLREAEDQVLIEVNTRIRELQDALNLVEVTELTERATREKARVLLNQYRQQTALLDDVLKAESEWSDAVDDHQQAVLSVRSAQAELQKAMGEE